jgi:hypothetical protein
MTDLRESRLFPEFRPEWAKDLPQEPDDWTYHSVLMTSAPISSACLRAADGRTLGRFVEPLNAAVERGGPLGNAFVTGLLEHASQLGIRKALRSHLSEKAKRELR